MFLQLQELFKLLNKAQRRKLIRLQFLVILMSILEVISVLAIGPFMSLIGDQSQLSDLDSVYGQAFAYSGFSSVNYFIILSGALSLTILIISALVSTFTIWRLYMYGSRVGADLSNRLFTLYLHKPWLYHSVSNSSELTNKIAQECQRITNGIIGPVMQMNAKLVLVVFMSTAIFIYNFTVTLIGLIIFVVAYFFLFKIARLQLDKNGLSITNEQAKRFKLMGEGFGGIKDTLLLGRQSIFIRRFAAASNRFARSQGNTQVLAQVPRYMLELLAYGSIISLILYLLITANSNLAQILPILSIYALAGFKLLPSLQHLYSSLSQIRGNLSSFNNLKLDLEESKELSFNDSAGFKISSPKKMKFKKALELESISFAYPGIANQAIENLNITIPKNHIIGIIGQSGSGKSTLVDLMLGLIEPNAGKLKVDGIDIYENRRAWQNLLGYVPQNIFLADASIRENIAFGLPDELINNQKIQDAVRLSMLDDFINSLPDGINTIVGERGVQLSGGQCQRIGIARALYENSEVLLMDEATSSLDGITEQFIMESIKRLHGKKTIILVAHRLATVRNCDTIFLLQDGKLIDHGTYEALLESNDFFKKLSQSA
jgi:HlyD family secretion protein